ncbi:hypothetical protein SSX86_002132 [Deinandra increscens subsp. villosa]|uniref:HTH myb-type domain-containing protein n=1 Tax=Deinandra increscens subsp. villosa TaxID=3103831 RepID=A0AAP0HCU6_9ASTR
MLVAAENNNNNSRDEECWVSDGDYLLESIDLDDLFVGMEEMLPALEMGDHFFSSSPPLSSSSSGHHHLTASTNNTITTTTTTSDDDYLTSQRQLAGPRSDHTKSKTNLSQASKIRKVKVDWTPELHRRFVQAVEQLGVDKAVPSRILEIMGVACLTRHNIASHLQKYRSHRKHVLAREAESAGWSQRRQMYCATKLAVGGGGSKRETGPWVAPTIGFFPHITQPPPHYRPLHVWGHPSVADHRPLMPAVWPKQPSTPTWPHPYHQRAPYLGRILPHMRFPHVAVPGIPPPHAMYKIEADNASSTTRSCPEPPLDQHPSMESIDAAIGDILTQPWQPLPLGLKPPALDSVMVELQKQGIQKVPPTCI